MFLKSFITNFIAALFVAISLLIDADIAKYFLYAGLFALSGALTNQLAIHMLFEKVPMLYGSGVIPNRFESFKASIKTLMMNQFFTKEQLQNFFAKEEKKIDLTPIIEKTDFSPAYDALTKTVMESSFGGMLGMFGGEKALEGLKEPFTEKLKSAVLKITSSESFDKTLQEHLKDSSLSDDLITSVEGIIDERLNELTPQIVKEIVQDLIKKHLDWLVVWGGVFGGVIGLASSLIL
ncbi:DUF445 domain-containing protein [Sulfurimonas lithotrophica]|uniref:DUF445 domain-containing protein n=1 Tax=Sulfurimonas lithotrophica TaxID=2590022 RepID=A0A5P8P1G7_9BACT|nr:DUF445 domain-containing protein [Sulfurimonas lithotrophica]